MNFGHFHVEMYSVTSSAAMTNKLNLLCTVNNMLFYISTTLLKLCEESALDKQKMPGSVPGQQISGQMGRMAALYSSDWSMRSCLRTLV